MKKTRVVVIVASATETTTTKVAISTSTKDTISIAVAKMAVEISLTMATEIDHMTLSDAKNTAKRRRTTKRNITKVVVTTQTLKKVAQDHVHLPVKSKNLALQLKVDKTILTKNNRTCPPATSIPLSSSQQPPKIVASY